MRKVKVLIILIGILLFSANSIYVPWTLEFSWEGEKNRPLGYHLIFTPPESGINAPAGVEIDLKRYLIQSTSILVLCGGMYFIISLLPNKKAPKNKS